MTNPRMYSLVAVILLVSLYRIIPHPPNFSPVLALALFSGAQFADRKTAIVVPLVCMLLADIYLGFHPTMIFVYLSLMLLVLLGELLQRRKTAVNVLGATVAGSLVFFIVTNLGAWWTMPHFYPRSFEGLITAYIAAIPFYQNTLLSGLLFAGILFGGYRLLEQRYPQFVSA